MCVSSKFPQKKLWLEDFVETEALYDVYISSTLLKFCS